jgi:hypothetical protein
MRFQLNLHLFLFLYHSFIALSKKVHSGGVEDDSKIKGGSFKEQNIGQSNFNEISGCAALRTKPDTDPHCFVI